MSNDYETTGRKYDLYLYILNWVSIISLVSILIFSMYSISDTRKIMNGLKECTIVYTVNNVDSSTKQWVDKNETCPATLDEMQEALDENQSKDIK